MYYIYQLIFSEAYVPDVTEVNALAKDGWELVQMGQAQQQGSAKQWWYLLRKKGTPAPAPEPV
jgi:hypothetical protein